MNVFYMYHQGRIRRILNTFSLRQSSLYFRALYAAGYCEIRSDEGEYLLYPVSEIDYTRFVVPSGARIIRPTSLAYYRAFADIFFFVSRLTTRLIIDNPVRYSYFFTFSSLDHAGVRIKELVALRDQHQISPSVFSRFLPLYEQQLPGQVSDSRFASERLRVEDRDPVTRQELEEYLHSRLISYDTYSESLSTLTEIIF